MKRQEEVPMKARMLLLPAMLVCLLCVPARGQIVVIANSSVSQSDVSRADLRDIFTGASSSLKGGATVTPVLLKDGAVNEEMLALYVGKSDSAFRASWRSLLFSGQAVLPRTLDTEAAVVDYVARTPGAIGYIGRGAPHEGVKTLAVR